MKRGVGTMRTLCLVTLIAGSAGIAGGCNSGGGSPGDGSGSMSGPPGGGPSSLVSITSSGAVAHQKGRIRVTFSNPVGAATDVTLASASTASATVPDHVTLPAGAASAEVEYVAVSPGQTIFQAVSGMDTQNTSAK